MPLQQEELGVLLLRVPIPPPSGDEIFELLFESEIEASIALSQIQGFSPIPCYEFRWFYKNELPVPQGTPQHRALLKRFGCMWRWEKVGDAGDDTKFNTMPID